MPHLSFIQSVDIKKLLQTVKKVCLEWWADSVEVLYTSSLYVSRKLRQMNKRSSWGFVAFSAVGDSLTWNNALDDSEVLKKKSPKLLHQVWHVKKKKKFGRRWRQPERYCLKLKRRGVSAWARTSLGDAQWCSQLERMEKSSPGFQNELCTVQPLLQSAKETTRCPACVMADYVWLNWWIL